MADGDIATLGEAQSLAGISPDLRKSLDEAMARYRAMTPEQQEAMWKAQRESWIRGMGSCEHGVHDWETCADCRSLPHDVA